MTAVEYKTKYPQMTDAEIERLIEIDKTYTEPKLCSILEPNCESCQ